MKIIHISDTFFDGFAYQDNEFSKIHERLGHEVVVVSLLKKYYTPLQSRNIPNENTYFIGRVKMIRLPLKYKWNYRFNKFKELYEVLKKENPDIIYLHQTPYMSVLDIVRYKKENREVRLIIDFHCDYNNSGTSFLSRIVLHKIWYRLLTLLTIKEIDMYYYITPDTKKFVQEMYLIPEQKLSFLPLGCDIEEVDFKNQDKIRGDLRSKLGIGLNEFVVITGGKLNKEKNTYNLVQAFHHLNLRDAHLIIFGEVEVEYKKILLDLISKVPNVHFIGWLNSAEIANYYLLSDVACFPGGQSVLWQQAIACGLPLLCYKWDGVEYLNVDNNVLFIENENVSSICEVLKKVYEDEALRRRMALGATTIGRDTFSYSRIAKQVFDFNLNKK